MQYLASAAQFALIVAIGHGLASITLGGQSNNLVMNPGAELGKGDMPSVWSAARVPADGLRMWRATDRVHSGKACLAISNTHQYDQPVSNNWMQRLKDVPRGKVIQLHLYVRAEDADAVNVCLQCWDIEGRTMLAFASTPVFRGDQDWTETNSRPFSVPDRTSNVIVRAALTGRGRAWFDDVSVIVLGSSDEADRRRGLSGVEKSGSDQDTRQRITNAKGDGSAASDKPATVRLADDLVEAAPGRVIRVVPIVKDCMILAYMPQWRHGNVDNLGVGNNSGGVRTLLQWGGIAQDEAMASDRKFFVALYSRKTTSKASGGWIEAYSVRDEWPELTSWQSQPGTYRDRPIGRTPFLAGEGWKLFEVTQLVRKQSTGRGNYGVLLRFDNESKTNESWSGYQFVSREGIDQWRTRHPALLVVDVSDASAVNPP